VDSECLLVGSFAVPADVYGAGVGVDDVNAGFGDPENTRLFQSTN